ncbi:MAG: adenylate/guanylate cyclase domain-containing protein, partial [Gaiellaceae bacterium]
KTQYVRSGDADIAYQVIGDGPRDIVMVLDWASHLEAAAELPELEDYLRALARFARVIWFDMRGIGMSDSVGGGVMPVESWVDDFVAVMDAVGSGKATLLVQGQATQMAVMAAATHPDRIASLVIVNGFARLARADDYPAGIPEHLHEVVADQVETAWGTGSLAPLFGPSRAGRPGLEEWWGRVERFGATPRLARARMEAVLQLDVRNALPLVPVPTLVIHNRDNAYVRVGHGHYLAEHIPGARLLERDSADHFTFPDPDLPDAIEEFVTGTRASPRVEERVLATVLFVDVVGSTKHASERGDRSWTSSLERFEEAARAALVSFDGVYDHSTGDGLLATFDGPARAIRCALSLRESVWRVGLEVRSGLHTGELTRTSEGVAGLAVHIGARVCDLAEPGEVLVTRTVRDLVAGSGISFEERGEHELKGVPETWAVYAAVA